ncbi:hypothetical protein [Microcoleus sp. bin38.metabat.b11b12b14.051]|uniref:hypothetical protein n=1 Tax=Microcoleus sp. bin38.metabat.b11b12b14.051 TaxID=2742709 RepID=UPI0025CCFA01|nr:hypothetical protein [Microcoleus sp. bin38.metabat.b11b12b14.051]
MPTPQENLIFVEQASCLFLTMIVFWGGQDAHPTRKFSFCGTGILPVPNNDCGTGILPVPNNGGRYEIN